MSLRFDIRRYDDGIAPDITIPQIKERIATLSDDELKREIAGLVQAAIEDRSAWWPGTLVSPRSWESDFNRWDCEDVWDLYLERLEEAVIKLTGYSLHEDL